MYKNLTTKLDWKGEMGGQEERGTKNFTFLWVKFDWRIMDDER